MLVLLAVCVLTNAFFVKAGETQEIFKSKQATTTLAKTSNVGLSCGDPRWRCYGTQPCCSSSHGWRCCPYSGGTCCAGGWRCCPPGQECICGFWCH
ncbi:hypothetical protein ACJMK2_024033 [Sinanodonta woodiana]|uniref:Granulins domain-containing protein n=1 Tax=Sinanodonta woodiana TaxID=1069815 RepID=A0ABD3T648_SINWO